MKVIVFVKATKDSEAGVMPSEQLLTEMTAYNEELVKAGIMLDGQGLHPSSKGARVRFSGKNRTVVDGPFAETKELVAGFWVWQVKSLADAIEWVKRCPNPMLEDSEIEIRQIFGPEDFGEALTPELREREDRMLKDSEINAALAPRFETGRELLIAGLNDTYTFESRVNIPKQWDRFAPHIGHIPGQIGKSAYGVCWNYRPGYGFDYLAGVEVSSTSGLPAEFTHLRLTAKKYAVFTHREHVSQLPTLIEAIWKKWMPNSGYKPSGEPEFERYTEEFNPQTGMGGTEVWIAIEE